jgi:hypothetical protein
MTLPLAHLGHFLWIFYVMPVVIVVAGILKSTLSERRNQHLEEEAPAAGGTRGDAENEHLARRHPPS